VATDDEIELDVERAVAGGRMLARHAGRIVFVAGAIPGERVRARVTKSSRQSLWADTTEVLQPSADRRLPVTDPACGGLAFAHIDYARQLKLKGQILADAFRRLARVDLEAPLVAPSAERGYRLRARLHVRDGRVGFFLEGTHTLCDARATGQLTPEALDAAESIVGTLGPRATDCEALVVSENVDGSERVIHLEPRDGFRLDDAAAGPVRWFEGGSGSVTGISTVVRGRLTALAGQLDVTDDATVLLGADAARYPGAKWRRRPTSFFQGNRFLTGYLVRQVLTLATGDRVADLYCGVGLFAVPLAARGARVLAVEGDRSSLDDLTANVDRWKTSVEIWRGAIEDCLRRPPLAGPSAVIVDPPRTGMSAEALDRLAAWSPPHIVYVSCDPATLARDSARLTGHGYRLLSLEGIDLFPNTPHVEAIAAFARP
jgi:23S rRNA (uracil1939-C5)-methyltransferase